MTFGTLAVIVALGLLGPALTGLPGLRLPLVLGELVAGIVFGRTGLHVLHSSEPTFAFLGSVGFALVMFEAGSHVPVRDARLRAALASGLARAVAIGVAATVIAVPLAHGFGSRQAGLFAVLMASSSAAIVLPIADALAVTDDPKVLPLLAQVAIADTVCIVAVPLAIDPAHAGRAAIGTAAVAVTAGLLFFAMRSLERSGWRRRLHRVSRQRKLALELRIDLVLLFALAALATRTHVSVMLAGFAFGLTVAGVGEPRRVARQLFAITDGFLGPLFFVWLGSSLEFADVTSHPRYLLLGLLLGLGAVLAHLVDAVSGLSLATSLLGSAQLGVPVAAATLGTQLDLLAPGEAPALIVGAAVTIVATTVGARLLRR